MRRQKVLLTTLPGESHGLGLQMAALICVEKGFPPHILGPETPIDEIAESVAETGAGIVAISVSLSSGGIETDRHLTALRTALPDRVALVIGGRGARGVRRGPRGVEFVDSLTGFAEWLSER